jgi:hypothetical protein
MTHTQGPGSLSGRRTARTLSWVGLALISAAIPLLLLAGEVYNEQPSSDDYASTPDVRLAGDLIGLLLLVLMVSVVLFAAAKVVDNVRVHRSGGLWVLMVNILGAAAATLSAVTLIVCIAAAGSVPAFVRSGIPVGSSVTGFVTGCVSGAVGCLILFSLGTVSLAARRRLALLRAPLPPVDTLAGRVAQAQESLARTGQSVRATLNATTASLHEALASTTGIVDALEEELRVRRSALDELTAQAQSAQARAQEARDLARIEESTAHALDALLDRRLAERLEAMEIAGHRWDAKVTLWSLLASLPVGIIAGYLVAVLSGH